MTISVAAHADPLTLVVSALRARGRNPKQKPGGEWAARCPAHDDGRASLTCSLSPAGKLLMRCFAGCTYHDILAALDLTSADVSPREGGAALPAFSPARAGHTQHLTPGAPAAREREQAPLERPAKEDRAPWVEVDRYEYTTADGLPVFHVVRHEPAVQIQGDRKKRFTQHRADGGAVRDLEWRPLLWLPLVQEAKDTGRPVLLVEGEKDARTAAALVAHGLTLHGAVVCPTTHAGGAANWRPEYGEQLAGADVVILPDNDEPGRQWALAAAAAIVAHGGSVRMLALPDVGPKGDLTDWCAAHHGGATPAAAAACSALLGRSTRWALGDPVPPPPARSRFTVLSDEELEALPPPTWLWDGLLPCEAMAALIGQPGAGKSFVALDLAASIAAGGSALGRPVEAGTVLYVAAEGTAGLPQRLAAWKQAHGHAGYRLPLHFVTQSVNLFAPGDEAHVVAACEQIATPGRPVRLVILDTLARVMPGGEENSAKDVGLVVEHAERIRRATGATVLLVHHTAKHSDTERGSSALRGAMDAILLVKTDDPDATSGVKLLVVEKQKDAAPAEPIAFTLDPVTAYGPHGRIDSCRVVVSATRWTDASNPWADESGDLTRTQLDALRVLRDVFGTSGATATEWLDATGLTKRTFYRARGVLERTNCVLNGTGRGQRYQVTQAGHHALNGVKVGATDGARLVPSECHEGATPGSSDGTSRAFSRAQSVGGGAGPKGPATTPPPSALVARGGLVPPPQVAPNGTGTNPATFDTSLRFRRSGGVPPEHRRPYRDFSDDEVWSA